jgi:hypothetical protein
MSAWVRDVMTSRVVTPDEPVTSAARLMYHARVKRLPVKGSRSLPPAREPGRPPADRAAA